MNTDFFIRMFEFDEMINITQFISEMFPKATKFAWTLKRVQSKFHVNA